MTEVTAEEAEAANSDEASVERRFGGWRRELRSFLELFALTGIAVAQPAFDVLRRNVYDVLLAGDATRFQIIALVAIILLVPAAALWTVEVVVGLAWPRARRYAHAALVGFAIAMVVLLVLTNETGVGGRLKLGIAVAVAVVGALLVFRLRAAQLFLRYLAVAPVLFAVLFLLSGTVSPLVLSPGIDRGVDVEIGKPDRVVMVVMDEFPLESLLDGEGGVDAELYPNFAALAADSTWYRNATTTSPMTRNAVPALVTGRYPTDPEAVQVATVYPESLFTLLGNTYEVNAHEHLESLAPAGDAESPEGLPWLLQKSYDLWRPRLWPDSDSFGAAASERIPQDLLDMMQPAGDKFVASLTASDDPRLDYLHVILPHSPWYLLPDGRSYADLLIETARPDVWSDTTLGMSAEQRYLLQVQATDRLIGQIVAKLRALGEYERTLLVVTADHGIGFRDGEPLRKATEANYDQVMWVPLFIKAPGQDAGVVDDRPAPAVDVFPTIAELLDTELPWAVDGRSLRGRPREDGPRRLLRMPSALLHETAKDAVYEQWDGPAGFARVLASRAANPGSDPDLRIYQGRSRFGALVGTAAAPLVRPGPTATTGSVHDPGRFHDVDPDGADAAFAKAQGTISLPVGRELAVAVNGTVAALTSTTAAPPFGGAYYAVLPPKLFRPGRNDVQVYEVAGTPDRPVLVPVSLAP